MVLSNQGDSGEEPETPSVAELTRTLLRGNDRGEGICRTRALQILKREWDGSPFPLPDPDEDDKWVLYAERERLDGQTFIGKLTTVYDTDDPCPVCENTRRERRWMNNGIITMKTIDCTICGHVHEHVDP